MQIRKIFITLCLMMIFVFCFINTDNVLAANSISISSNTTTPCVGDDIMITVQFKSDEEFFAVNYEFSYNNAIFERTDQTSNGVIYHGMVSENPSGDKTFTVQYTFKVKAAGVSDFTIKNVEAASVADPDNMATVTINSLTGYNSWAEGSNNAYLSKIELSNGSVNFKKTTNSYTVYVANTTSKITINAKAEATTSKIAMSKANPVALEVGTNTVNIVVTAADGTKNTYTLTIVRAKPPVVEQPTEPPTQAPTEPPTTEGPKISVTVDGNNFYLKEDLSDYQTPSGYSKIQTEYQGKQVEVLKGNTNGVTLLVLLNDDKIDFLYRYDEANKKLVEYKAIGDYIIIEAPTEDNVTAALTKKAEIIGNQEITMYEDGKQQIYQYCYAINKNGEKNWYMYDSIEGTLQRADMSKFAQDAVVVEPSSVEVEKLKAEIAKLKQKKIFSPQNIIIVVLIIIIIILIILVIAKSNTGSDVAQMVQINRYSTKTPGRVDTKMIGKEVENIMASEEEESLYDNEIVNTVKMPSIKLKDDDLDFLDLDDDIWS